MLTSGFSGHTAESGGQGDKKEQVFMKFRGLSMCFAIGELRFKIPIGRRSLRGDPAEGDEKIPFWVVDTGDDGCSLVRIVSEI